MKTTRALGRAALLALVGAVTSGPLGLWLVTAVAPQPPWVDGATFAAAFHPVQLVPYLFGFLLIGGCVAVVAALHAMAPPPLRTRSGTALALAAAFAAMILLNYVLQTTFVPTLAARRTPGDDALLAAFSMANPRSLAWALEMWGYGVLGVATWLLAPVLAGAGAARTARALCVANGVLSIAGGVATAAWPGWVLLPSGLVAYALWNALVIALFALLAWMGLRAPRSTAPLARPALAGAMP